MLRLWLRSVRRPPPLAGPHRLEQVGRQRRRLARWFGLAFGGRLELGAAESAGASAGRAAARARRLASVRAGAPAASVGACADRSAARLHARSLAAARIARPAAAVGGRENLAAVPARDHSRASARAAERPASVAASENQAASPVRARGGGSPAACADGSAGPARARNPRARSAAGAPARGRNQPSCIGDRSGPAGAGLPNGDIDRAHGDAVRRDAVGRRNELREAPAVPARPGPARFRRWRGAAMPAPAAAPAPAGWASLPGELRRGRSRRGRRGPLASRRGLRVRGSRRAARRCWSAAGSARQRSHAGMPGAATGGAARPPFVQAAAADGGILRTPCTTRCNSRTATARPIRMKVPTRATVADTSSAEPNTVSRIGRPNPDQEHAGAQRHEAEHQQKVEHEKSAHPPSWTGRPARRRILREFPAEK